MKKILYVLSLVLLVASCEQQKSTVGDSNQNVTKKKKSVFVNIGTGGVTGVYYPTGGAICNVINKMHKDIKCTVEATAASVYNANSIAAGKMDLGIVQSDVAYKAMKGEDPFSKAETSLRSMMSIHSESLTLVVRKDAGIKTFADLKGKKVNVGNPGSGTRRTVETLFTNCGLNLSDLSFQGELKAAEMPDALRDKKLDAYFYVVGHPTANLKDIATSTDIDVIALDMPCINALVEKESYFVKTKIPGGLYKGVDQAVDTFGFKATLLASDKLSEDAAYKIIQAVIENFETFKTLHPSYADLSTDEIFTGLSLPLHSGVEKYLAEKRK